MYLIILIGAVLGEARPETMPSTARTASVLSGERPRKHWRLRQGRRCSGSGSSVKICL
jgi:hypothetical protein